MQEYLGTEDFEILNDNYCYQESKCSKKFLTCTSDFLRDYKKKLMYEKGTIIEIESIHYVVLGYDLCYVLLADMDDNNIFYCPFSEITDKKVDSIPKKDVDSLLLKFVLMNKTYKPLLKILDIDKTKKQIDYMIKEENYCCQTYKYNIVVQIADFLLFLGIAVFLVYLFDSLIFDSCHHTIVIEGLVLMKYFINAIKFSFLFFLPNGFLNLYYWWYKKRL